MTVFHDPDDVAGARCDHPNSWFDRTLCDLDDFMHTCCTACGQPLDGTCGAWFEWLRSLSPGELSRMVHADPRYAEDHAAADADIAAGRVMTLSELRASLGFPSRPSSETSQD